MPEESAATAEPAAKLLSIDGNLMPQAQAEQSQQSAANWFWWIAGLSLVNSVAAMLKLEYGLAIGLGITQVFDLFVTPSDVPDAQISMTARAIHLALVLFVAGIFYFIGVRARRRSLLAFKVGMALYTLDGLLFVLVSDWFGAGFHAFVLYMLWSGLGLTKKVNEAIKATNAVAA